MEPITQLTVKRYAQLVKKNLATLDTNWGQQKARVNGSALVDDHSPRPLVSKCREAKIFNALRKNKGQKGKEALLTKKSTNGRPT